MLIGELNQHCGNCSIIDFCGKTFSELQICSNKKLQHIQEDRYIKIVEKIENSKYEFREEYEDELDMRNKEEVNKLLLELACEEILKEDVGNECEAYDKEKVFLLYSSNEWKERSSAVLIGISKDINILYKLISHGILCGNMVYASKEKSSGYDIFMKDVKNHSVKIDLIDYGYIDTADVLSKKSE